MQEVRLEELLREAGPEPAELRPDLTAVARSAALSALPREHLAQVRRRLRPSTIVAAGLAAAVTGAVGIVIGLALDTPAGHAEGVSIEARIGPKLGISMDVPNGWSSEIYNNQPRGLPSSALVHLASFQLPVKDDDIGTNAEQKMKSDDILIVVLESTGSKTGFEYPALRTRLKIGREDFLPAFEGVPASHAFARRLFSTHKRRFMLWIQFGKKRVTDHNVQRANEVLGSFVFH